LDFTAVDADSKLMMTWLAGARSQEDAMDPETAHIG
jgi:hypothetical protein